jgi:hypothetical protein
MPRAVTPEPSPPPPFSSPVTPAAMLAFSTWLMVRLGGGGRGAPVILPRAARNGKPAGADWSRSLGRRTKAIHRPVWTAAVHAGRTPGWLCLIASHLISNVILPAGTALGGLFATCQLAGGPVTFGWPVAGWVSMWHWPSWAAWWDTSAATGTWMIAAAFLATWWLAGCVAEKLVKLELRPGQPPAATRTARRRPGILR